MLASIRATVLAARPRTDGNGKSWVTVYLLQEGRTDPVQAYYAPSDLKGHEPQQGDVIVADVLVYGDRNGRLAVRLDEVADASALRAAG